MGPLNDENYLKCDEKNNQIYTKNDTNNKKRKKIENEWCHKF